MANTFGNGVYNEAFWAAEMQGIFQRENIAVSVANLDLRKYLKKGDTVHKAYGTYPTTATYTKGTAITIPDYSGTDESLVVDTAKVAPMYIDHIDRLQNKWDQAEVFARRGGRALKNVMEQAMMAQYSNARSSIVASDMGGSGSGTFTMSQAKISQLFTVANRKLSSYDVPDGNKFAIIGPRLREYLQLYCSGRETSWGDSVGDNGFIGRRFGFDIIYSNNLYWGGTWTPANNPSNGDTVTIHGVTFNFVATIGSTAGNIHIGSNTAETLDNLVYGVNGSGGTENTDWVDVSKRNRWILDKAGIVATDGTTNATFVGYGDIVVSASESADVWSAETQYPLFGVKGSINMVVQQAPNVEFRMVQDKLGRNVFVWCLYGLKTFEEDKDALVYATVNTHAWT